MKNLMVFFTVFAFFTLLAFGGIQLDLLLNPWLRHAVQEWKWYNYFTSHHAITALYLLHGWLWLFPSLIISAIASLVAVVVIQD